MTSAPYCNVKTFRVLRHISQEEMAKILGISKDMYIRKESGNVEFLLDEAIKISKVLEVPLEVLFE